MNDELLPTAAVGSYPQPGRLLGAQSLSGRAPRVRGDGIWRVTLVRQLFVLSCDWTMVI